MTAGSTLPQLEARAVLFDLDGTLVDTLPDLHAAVCAMLSEIGRPPVARDTTRAYIGKGLRVLILEKSGVELSGPSLTSPYLVTATRTTKTSAAVMRMM